MKMSKIFLSGGGSKEYSASLDRQFVGHLKTGKILIYVPVAMDEERHQKCLEWFESIFKPLHCDKIAMLTDLNCPLPLNNISGIYMGGGHTGRLLDKIISAGFDKYLYTAATKGIPIYGGSAGAIVLGDTIITAPKEEHSDSRFVGMQMLNGYSVVCHHDSEDYTDIKNLAKVIDCPLLVLSKYSGAVIIDGGITTIGSRPIVLSKNGETTKIHVGNKLVL